VAVFKEGFEPVLPPLFPQLYSDQTGITTNNSEQLSRLKASNGKGYKIRV